MLLWLRLWLLAAVAALAYGLLMHQRQIAFCEAVDVNTIQARFAIHTDADDGCAAMACKREVLPLPLGPCGVVWCAGGREEGGGGGGWQEGGRGRGV